MNPIYPDIKDKVAIVTGAAEGIGHSITEMLLASGAKVVLNDIDGAHLNQIIQPLNDTYTDHVLPCPGDAGDIATIDKMIAFALEHFKGLDLVVANAGITLFGDFFEFTPEKFQKIVDLNLKGTFF